jgi:hypothetical protein
VQQDYAALLGGELDETVPLAACHQWQSTRYDSGVALRKELAIIDDKIEHLKKCL